MVTINCNLFPDVKIFIPKINKDERGFFIEIYNDYIKSSLNINFNQDNHTLTNINVFRGLHYQHTIPTGKLCTVIYGSILLVLLDLRLKSKTYRRHKIYKIDNNNNNILWIPSGFACGYLATSNNTHVVYKCSESYRSEYEGQINVRDKLLNIPLPDNIILSKKDKNSKGILNYELDPKFL